MKAKLLVVLVNSYNTVMLDDILWSCWKMAPMRVPTYTIHGAEPQKKRKIESKSSKQAIDEKCE